VRHCLAGRIVVADLDERHGTAGADAVKGQAVHRQYAVLNTVVVMAAIERFGVRVTDIHVVVNVVVVVRMIDAILSTVDPHFVDQQFGTPAGTRNARPRWRVLRMTNGCDVSGPTRLTPSPILMPYSPSECDSLSSKRTNGSVRMSTVLRVPSACMTGKVILRALVCVARNGSRNGRFPQETLRVNVFRLFDPPVAGAFVLVERQRLFGSRLPRNAWTCEITVEDVEHLGAVFEKEAVPNALVANTVLDEQILCAMNRHPTIGVSQIDAPITELPRIVSPTR